MIIRDAFHSLKDDFSRTFFYFLTFFFTTMFMFLFFNMAFSEMAVNEDILFLGNEANVSDYLQNGDIANLMMAFVLVLSVIDIVFANRFFIRNKAEELAVRLVCGATFTQMAGYLLVQTFVLLLFAVPLGIACGMALIPAMNQILVKYLESSFVITIQGQAIAQFSLIIFFIIMWTTMLNLSYVYQNEAAKILNGQGEDTDKNGSMFGDILGKVPQIVKTILGIICFIYPLYAFHTQTDAMAMYAIVGVIGLEFVIRYVIEPGITKAMKNRYLKRPIQSAMMGFLRDDFMHMRITIYLFIVNAVLMMAILVMRMGHPIAFLMIVVTYIFMSFLQALTIMFRLQTIQSTRTGEIGVLMQIGFEKKQCLKVIFRESICFFLSVFVMVMLFMVNIFIALVRQGIVSSSFAFAMCGVLFISLFIAWMISYVYYRNIIVHVES